MSMLIYGKTQRGEATVSISSVGPRGVAQKLVCRQSTPLRSAYHCRGCVALLLVSYLSSASLLPPCFQKHFELTLGPIVYVRRCMRGDARLLAVRQLDRGHELVIPAPGLGCVNCWHRQLIKLPCCTPSAARHRRPIRLKQCLKRLLPTRTVFGADRTLGVGARVWLLGLVGPILASKRSYSHHLFFKICQSKW
jgi:hypothetical protein